MNTKIESIASCVPENKITSEELEQKISKTFRKIPFWILEEMTGVKNRYFVGEWEYSSDLAIRASEMCFEKSSIKKEEIDLLIFASASQDITEPATANIIQKELWLMCPVFDLKNACNSFLNGMDVADSYIRAGKYKNILVCSGETPSKVIKYDIKNREEFKQYFAGYTLWDAGAAMILTETKEHSWILSTYLYSDGSSWDLATIMWWGSRFPDDLSKRFFSGNPWEIRNKFMELWNTALNKELDKVWWRLADISKIFVHQVAMSNFDAMEEILQIDRNQLEIILPEYWNIASCCLPTAFDNHRKSHILKKWDKFLFIWLASGFSYWLMCYEV